MKIVWKQKTVNTDRRRERGVALISTLLLATLLLTAGGALVLTTTLSATNAIDTTAEMQAYYGAEAGLQATINLLRGNVWNDNSTPAASFRAATEPSEANASGDSATAQNISRLSKWFSYDANNHVVVAGTDGLIAYDVTARDLDDSKNVRFSTSAVLQANTSGCTVAGLTLTCVNGLNSFALTYTPQSAATILAYPATTTSLGSFRLVVVGTGASIPAGQSAGFLLTFNQTLPWAAKDNLIGTISGDVNALNSNLVVTFSGSTVKADGTKFALCSGCNPLSLNHQLVLSGVTALSGTITAPQPRRVLVRTTGYGPKGAVKRLEMLLNQSAFDFDAPAVLTMRGADDCSAGTFDTGSSGAKSYSGTDNAGAEAQLPTFAVSGCNLAQADSGISNHNTVVDPEFGYLDVSGAPSGTTVSSLQVQTPGFLQTADNARATLNDLQATAISLGRYFTPATTGGSVTVSASNTTPEGMTFVDGNCILDGGSGLLVVTGDLTMSGNPNFSGVILVLGGGSVNRNGGGNGNIYGALVVAAFDRYGTGGFTAPYFNTSGGGNSTMQYDSFAVSRAMAAAATTVGGIREY